MLEKGKTRLNGNEYTGYLEEYFTLGVAIPKEGCEYFLANNLYRDEAVIISHAMQVEGIFHYIGKDKKNPGRYEAYIAYENAQDHDRLDRIVFALKNIISNLTGIYVIWEISTINLLVYSKNGALIKIISTGDDKKECDQIARRMTSYLQKLVRE